jgi:hypothetical protein
MLRPKPRTSSPQTQAKTNIDELQDRYASHARDGADKFVSGLEILGRRRTIAWSNHIPVKGYDSMLIAFIYAAHKQKRDPCQSGPE